MKGQILERDVLDWLIRDHDCVEVAEQGLILVLIQIELELDHGRHGLYIEGYRLPQSHFPKCLLPCCRSSCEIQKALLGLEIRVYQEGNLVVLSFFFIGCYFNDDLIELNELSRLVVLILRDVELSLQSDWCSLCHLELPCQFLVQRVVIEPKLDFR